VWEVRFSPRQGHHHEAVLWASARGWGVAVAVATNRESKKTPIRKHVYPKPYGSPGRGTGAGATWGLPSQRSTASCTACDLQRKVSKHEQAQQDPPLKRVTELWGPQPCGHHVWCYCPSCVSCGPHPPQPSPTLATFSPFSHASPESMLSLQVPRSQRCDVERCTHDVARMTLPQCGLCWK
jgi:hypothetical protein